MMRLVAGTVYLVCCLLDTAGVRVDAGRSLENAEMGFDMLNKLNI